MVRKFTLSAFTFLICVAGQAQAPANYYNGAAGKSCSELKTALKTIVSTMTAKDYNSLWNEYTINDVKPREIGAGSTTVIYDLYSNVPGLNNDPYNFIPGVGRTGQQDQGGTANAEGILYNREHSVPISWFNGSTSSLGPATDYNHIFPVDKYLNGKRANFPYGKVGNATFTSLNGSKLGTSATAGVTGTVFEPIDSSKGDLARAFLYFVTRYQDDMATFALENDAAQSFEPNTYPSVDIPYLKLMISWHKLDPVSQKEIDRNNGTMTYQGNRNPYIDHPEYVDLVWNSTCPGLSALPVEIVSFEGQLENNTVRLEWLAGNEARFDRYEVERSYNGTTYNNIATVKATGAGRYVFNDDAANNDGRQVFYRLKKYDKDGSFTYSPVFSIHVPANTKFTIYPNPVVNTIRLQLNKNVTGKVVITVTDLAGRQMFQNSYTVSNSRIDVPATNLAAGTYLVDMRLNNGHYTSKVVVNK